MSDEILVLVNLVWVHADNAVAKKADVGADKFLAVAQAESIPLGVVDREVWPPFVGLASEIFTQNKQFLFQAIDQPLELARVVKSL
jgi:hypothetical protein